MLLLTGSPAVSYAQPGPSMWLEAASAWKNAVIVLEFAQ
jgi:hypothetical protein